MFAERLRSAREYRKHSQASLAELLDVAPQQIYRLETGKHVPASDTVTMLAKVLDVTTDYLLGLSDDMLGWQSSDLEPDERRVLDALRHGDKMEAIKVIVGG